MAQPETLVPPAELADRLKQVASKVRALQNENPHQVTPTTDIPPPPVLNQKGEGGA